MLAGIQDILIISTPTDTPRFEALLGDRSQFGVHLSYKVQPSPDGLAQAFILGEDFIRDDACAITFSMEMDLAEFSRLRLRMPSRRRERLFSDIMLMTRNALESLNLTKPAK